MIYAGIYALIGIILWLITLVRHWDIVRGEEVLDSNGNWVYHKWDLKVKIVTSAIVLVLFVFAWPIFIYMSIKDYRRGLGW